MGHTEEFYYEPEAGDTLSVAVVSAIAAAHDEEIIDQEWRISDDINTDALDALFQDHNLKMTLQFEADTTTATIIADKNGNPIIKIESHR
ncbi:HalOD1 output domain-containing protein [Halobacterium wangiae]|uniref:HalOD1 output domain-containing protein n=1 Tax=Halobacterium wangiae TaxID=2902623 RepID=UPI001E4EE861|nr:HalOD1 output domain-containing protein [Halobacterium wangiae]